MEKEEKIQKQISKLEAKLFEQEYRSYNIIKNFINRNDYDKRDPRRKAILISFVWRLFFSPGVIATGGGIIAIISLFILSFQTRVLIKQNNLITKQNNLVFDQNNKINQQNYLVEAQRRSSLQFETSEILNRLDAELKLSLDRKISNQLKGRIIAVTIAMKSYRSFEDDTLSKPYSYEKSHLFTSLLNSDINNNDLSEIFEKGNFSNMILHDIIIGQNNQENNSKDSKINIYSSIKLRDCYLRNVKFNNTHFSKNIVFENSILEEVETRNSLSKQIILSNSLLKKSYITFGNIKKPVLNTNNFVAASGTLLLQGSRIEKSTLILEQDYHKNTFSDILVEYGMSSISGSILALSDLNITSADGPGSELLIKDSYIFLRNQEIHMDEYVIIESLYSNKKLNFVHPALDFAYRMNIQRTIFRLPSPSGPPWHSNDIQYSKDYFKLPNNKHNKLSLWNLINRDVDCYKHTMNENQNYDEYY